jgi:hypothetical protein
MFFEVTTTIVSKVQLTDDGLEVDSHAIDIASDDPVPETVVLAVVYGGLKAAIRKVEQRDPQIKAAAKRTDGDDT